MITILNRKQLCTVFSMKEQSDIRQSLSMENIDYYIKTINRVSASGFSSSMRSRIGSFGQNMDLNYEYIFYVHRKDYERAKFIINR